MVKITYPLGSILLGMNKKEFDVITDCITTTLKCKSSDNAHDSIPYVEDNLYSDALEILENINK